jgi:signal transduction histidine kinase
VEPDEARREQHAHLRRNAYRIVQEALSNARKHAHGAAVELYVGGDAAGGLTIEVRNRLPVGAATGPEIPGAGTGIVGPAERASLAGGRLEHGRTPDGDYRLWAWLPWTGDPCPDRRRRRAGARRPVDDAGGQR